MTCDDKLTLLIDCNVVVNALLGIAFFEQHPRLISVQLSHFDHLATRTHIQVVSVRGHRNIHGKERADMYATWVTQQSRNQLLRDMTEAYFGNSKRFVENVSDSREAYQEMIRARLFEVKPPR